MNILLVDDNAQARADVREALARIYSGQSYTVHEHADPQQALAEFSRDSSIDVIITDIVMPGMSGIQLAQGALEQRVVPIVLHTGSWSKEVVAHLAFNGGLRDLPIEVAMKRYFYPDDAAYSAHLRQALDAATEKASQTTSLRPELLAAVHTRLMGRSDTDVCYVRQVFDELIERLRTEARHLETADRDELMKLDWDLSADTTRNLLHTLGYPLSALQQYVRQHIGDSFETIRNIHGLMQRIVAEINAHYGRYSVSMLDAVNHNKALQSQPRIDFSLQHYPVKLRHRELMLQGTETPFVVLKPGEDSQTYRTALESVLSVTGSAIARSMHCAEDAAGMPLAGYFDSKVFNSLEEAAVAVHAVRTTRSKDLEQFCFYRGFKQPTTDGMFVGIEPYHATTYVGAALQHPTQRNIVLIEFSERIPQGDRVNYFVVYDTDQKTVVGAPKMPTDIDPTILAQKVHDLFVAQQQKLSSNGVSVDTYAQQMELGFDAAMDAIGAYQLRNFRMRDNHRAFGVAHPISSVTTFGTTEQAGVELVVTTTSDHDALHLLGKRTEEDGRGVCYVMREGINPNIACCTDNLGLLVLGKDAAVQSHGYFNAMVAAQRVLLLNQAQFAALQIEDGNVVHYVSNGPQASLTRVDTSSALKYRIRELLNQ